MSKFRTLDDVLTDYAKADKKSKLNLDAVAPASRPGHAIAIREATAKLPTLRVEYLTGILKNAVGFFTEGDPAKAETFAKISSENGAFDLNAAAIFEVLADQIQVTMGGKREFSVTQVGQLDTALKTLVAKTGYEGPMNRISISDLRVVPTREKLVTYIKDLVTKTNGSTPSVVSLQDNLVNQALKQKFAGKRLVAVVRNASQSDRAGLMGLFSRVVKVNVDEADVIDEKFARYTIEGALRPAKPAVAPQKAEEIPPLNQNQSTQE